MRVPTSDHEEGEEEGSTISCPIDDVIADPSIAPTYPPEGGHRYGPADEEPLVGGVSRGGAWGGGQQYGSVQTGIVSRPGVAGSSDGSESAERAWGGSNPFEEEVEAIAPDVEEAVEVELQSSPDIHAASFRRSRLAEERNSLLLQQHEAALLGAGSSSQRNSRDNPATNPFDSFGSGVDPATNSSATNDRSRSSRPTSERIGRDMNPFGDASTSRRDSGVHGVAAPVERTEERRGGYVNDSFGWDRRESEGMFEDVAAERNKDLEREEQRRSGALYPPLPSAPPENFNPFYSDQIQDRHVTYPSL